MITAFPAWAGGREPYNPIDAQKLIDVCKAKYKDFFSTAASTVDMRKGSMKIIQCYENTVLDQTKFLFKPEYLSRDEIKGKLDRIVQDYGGLYWSIYNEHRGCRIPGISCGTMYHLFHYGPIEAILEKMIYDIVSQRNKYELQ